MTTQQIADAIDAHLQKWERDKAINKNSKADGSGTSDYYHAGASRAGSYVAIVYVSYQFTSKLPKKSAAHYLAMIEAGFVGRHYEAFRRSPVPV